MSNKETKECCSLAAQKMLANCENESVNDKNSKIKIVIDNLYDDDLKIDGEIIIDETITNENCSLNDQPTDVVASSPITNRFDTLSEKSNTKKDGLFNWGSILTALDDRKLRSRGKNSVNCQRVGSAELGDNPIAYL